MKKLFGKKDKDEKKTEEKKPAAIKPSISQPINYNPPSKQAIVQPSSTMQITASNTLETANENMEENPQQIDNLPPQTLIEMKKGDYNVHILIENVKNLVPVEENVPPYPRVKLTVFGKEKRTAKMKKPCFDYTFNEHFYYDKTNLTVEMLDSEKIIIEVYDNKHTKKEKYFGIYEMDFAYVYGRPNHTIKNTWIGLSNPESDDMTKIRGYLKLSVSVLNENDNRVELEPKENSDEACLIPNEIKMKYKQITFYFIRGEKFPDMDAIFSEKKGSKKQCDGYIVLKYMGITKKTKIVAMKDEVCLWYQAIDIPATFPCVSQKICLTVFDEDKGRKDDIVGSYEFYINDIYDGKYSKFDYINIYGSPLNKHTKIAEQMAFNAEIGSRWNGRVLMKCEVRDVDSPISGVREISDNKITQEGKLATTKMTNEWEIWIRVISGLYLPRDKRKYIIKGMVQDNVCETNKKESANFSIDFNETIKLKFQTINPEKSSLPDLFIYLVDTTKKEDVKHVCFQRIKCEEFYLSQDVLYIKLLPDPVINKVQTMKESGLLKCKICLFNTKIDKPPDTKEFEKGGQFQLASLENSAFFGEQSSFMKYYKIIAVVYMSKDLIAAESNGTSDPYVTLSLGNKELSTTAKHNTMNGVWNELLEYEQVYMDIKDQRTWPVFSLNVWDKNKVLKDVPLGYNYIWLSNTHFSVNSFELIKPKWHDLYLPKSNKQQGKILMAFYLFDQTIKLKGQDLYNKINFLPKTQLYNFEINVLGLRELRPLGLISVKKPFIKFDLNSVNVTGKPEDDHEPVKTIPVSGGENPTINTLIQFETKLPIQDEFLPELQCEVYDNILSGMANSLLGVFTLNLKKIIKQTRLQVQEDIDNSRADLGMKSLGTGLFRMLNIDFKNMNFGNNNLINTNTNLIDSNPNIIDTNTNIINTNSNLINTNESNDNINTNIINTNIIKNENINNNNLLGEGMKEKNEDDKLGPEDNINNINNESNENNTINTNTNTNSNKSEDALSTSNVSGGLSHKSSVDLDDERERFLEDDDNKFTDEKTNGQQVNINEIKTKNVTFTIFPNRVEMDWNVLKGALDDPNNFVILPSPMNFHIPGYAVDERDIKDGEEKVQKELLIEDPNRVPDEQLYFKVGYMLKYEKGTKPAEITKHYRRIYRGPLENFELPNLSLGTPFDVRKIRRGKYVDKKSETELFDAMSSVNGKIIHKFSKEKSFNDVDTSKALTYKDFSSYDDIKKKKEERKEQKEKEKNDKKNMMMFTEGKGEKSYGKFKGIVRVTEHNLLKEYEKAIKDAEEKSKLIKAKINMKNFTKYNELREKLLNKREVIIRVYILRMLELAKRDLFSESDPYVKIYLNNKLVVNEKKNYQQDQKNCDWYKHYDITGDMPGSSNLKIEVMDYDDVLSDDLIGYTVIDLEDRYFNSDWQNIREKPIEIRPLINLDYPGAQGYVYMWLDIFDASIKSQKEPWQIAPEPITEFEVRFVVWETEDMEMMDVEGTSDIYIVSYIDQKDNQKTDVHYRCQDGNASFNWRNLLPLKLPIQNPLLTVQVYDKDIFSSDDYISGATINLKDLMTLPKYLGMPVKFTKTYYEGLSPKDQEIYGDIEFLNENDDEDGIKFWVQCYKGKKDASGEGEKGGRVLCTLEILPKALADKNKLGLGRSNPNKDPYCPPPTGRMECSLNPCKMINQCVGPKFRKKCYCYIIMCLVIVYLVIGLPTIIGNILSP